MSTKGFIPGNFIRSLQRVPRNPTKVWKLYENMKTRTDRLQFLFDTIPLSGTVLPFDEFFKFVEKPCEFSHFVILFEKIFGSSSTKSITPRKIPKILSKENAFAPNPKLDSIPYGTLWEIIVGYWPQSALRYSFLFKLFHSNFYLKAFVIYLS